MGRRAEFGAGHGQEIDLTDGPKTMHLPPTPQAMEQLTQLVEQHKADVRSDKAKGARESDQNDKAKRSVYGMGGNKALRKHLGQAHELLEEDAMEMERPHHFHREWHTKGEYNPDKHEH